MTVFPISIPASLQFKQAWLLLLLKRWLRVCTTVVMTGAIVTDNVPESSGAMCIELCSVSLQFPFLSIFTELVLFLHVPAY